LFPHLRLELAQSFHEGRALFIRHDVQLQHHSQLGFEGSNLLRDVEWAIHLAGPRNGRLRELTTGHRRSRPHPLRRALLHSRESCRGGFEKNLLRFPRNQPRPPRIQIAPPPGGHMSRALHRARSWGDHRRERDTAPAAGGETSTGEGPSDAP